MAAKQVILVATDMGGKASLTVLHCFESPEVGVKAHSSPRSRAREVRKIDAETVDRYNQLFERERVRGQFDVIDGESREAIVRKAEQLDADLIVVGTRGRAGLERIMFGSVAETVARTASCPVLAVRLGDIS